MLMHSRHPGCSAGPGQTRRTSAPRAGALLLWAAIVPLTVGCVSGSDIEGLHRHVGDVEKKVDELAKQSRVSRQHIRDLELPIPKKRVTIETLEKLAKGLRLPHYRLLQFK